jgi:hypothetical protein
MMPDFLLFSVSRCSLALVSLTSSLTIACPIHRPTAPDRARGNSSQKKNRAACVELLFILFELTIVTMNPLP